MLELKTFLKAPFSLLLHYKDKTVNLTEKEIRILSRFRKVSRFFRMILFHERGEIMVTGHYLLRPGLA